MKVYGLEWDGKRQTSRRLSRGSPEHQPRQSIGVAVEEVTATAGVEYWAAEN